MKKLFEFLKKITRIFMFDIVDTLRYLSFRIDSLSAEVNTMQGIDEKMLDEVRELETDLDHLSMELEMITHDMRYSINPELRVHYPIYYIWDGSLKFGIATNQVLGVEDPDIFVVPVKTDIVLATSVDANGNKIDHRLENGNPDGEQPDQFDYSIAYKYDSEVKLQELREASHWHGYAIETKIKGQDLVLNEQLEKNKAGLMFDIYYKDKKTSAVTKVRRQKAVHYRLNI